jgi:hypothetical protein
VAGRGISHNSRERLVRRSAGRWVLGRHQGGLQGRLSVLRQVVRREGRLCLRHGLKPVETWPRLKPHTCRRGPMGGRTPDAGAGRPGPGAGCAGGLGACKGPTGRRAQACPWALARGAQHVVPTHTAQITGRAHLGGGGRGGWRRAIACAPSSRLRRWHYAHWGVHIVVDRLPQCRSGVPGGFPPSLSTLASSTLRPASVELADLLRVHRVQGPSVRGSLS